MNELTSRNIYLAFIQGAKQVMKNRHHLNEINVFPVRDGDTGSNLFSMMRSIITDAKTETTVKATITSVSDAALRGARGNSGIIFAQYLSGISTEMSDAAEVTLEHFALASNSAVKYAYEAIDNPVEGTMITVMKTWGQSLVNGIGLHKDSMLTLDAAYDALEVSLKGTQYQLADLKRAGVVDSGAKGFVYFIKGMLDYFKHGDSIRDIIEDEAVEALVLPDHAFDQTITYRYCTEGFLTGKNLDISAIRRDLRRYGDSLVVAGNASKCRVHIHTDAPSEVFEALYTLGTITYQKADDMVRQKAIVMERKSTIALVTDSIADLPEAFVDERQIHVIHLNLLYKDVSFIDKLTVTPRQILEYSRDDHKLPTSSQPDPKQIENLFGYLKSYYDSVIVMTVSKELSGTYSNVSKEADKARSEDFPITVINTRQNSGAQGLLVAKAARLIEGGNDHRAVVAAVEKAIPKSKILVRVKTLDNMVKSGRLSTKAGKIGKIIGLKPIVTLDKDGVAGLDGVAFSIEGSLKKLIGHMRKIMKTNTVENYSIVHVNNPDEAEIFKEVFTQVIGREPDYVTETSSIVAVGAGSGAVALSYILKD